MWKHASEGGDFDISVFGTVAEPKLSEAEMARLWCHVLIQLLDEKGISEALESLKRMVLYYASQTEAVEREPAPVRIKARVVGRSPEPVYPLTEE